MTTTWTFCKKCRTEIEEERNIGEGNLRRALEMLWRLFGYGRKRAAFDEYLLSRFNEKEIIEYACAVAELHRKYEAGICQNCWQELGMRDQVESETIFYSAFGILFPRKK